MLNAYAYANACAFANASDAVCALHCSCGCPRMPQEAPRSSQEASSCVFSGVGETPGAESYVFLRAGEAPVGGERRDMWRASVLHGFA